MSLKRVSTKLIVERGEDAGPKNSSHHSSEERDVASIDEQTAINNLMMQDELDLEKLTREDIQKHFSRDSLRNKTYSGTFWPKDSKTNPLRLSAQQLKTQQGSRNNITGGLPRIKNEYSMPLNVLSNHETPGGVNPVMQISITKKLSEAE